jgi:uncharacterized membrane protein
VIKRSLIVLAIIGLADSLYLTWIKFSGSEAICSGVGGCDVVNTSEYALLAGIPIALFGAAAYVAILLVLWLENRNSWLTENGPLLLFGITLFGFLYSLYLTYIELFVIFAICPFCVASAVVLTIMFALSWIRLRNSWSLE